MSFVLAKLQLDAIADACQEHQLAAITGQPVDLVMADAVHNPFVRADIDASKQLIYGVVE